MAYVPFDRDICAVSDAVWNKFGFEWRGGILLFKRACYSDLCVNMRTWPADRETAWKVIRGYVGSLVTNHG